MKSNHKSPYIAWLHSYKMFRIGKFIETESWLVVQFSLCELNVEVGGIEEKANEYRVSFSDDENILKLDCGDGWTMLWIC